MSEVEPTQPAADPHASPSGFTQRERNTTDVWRFRLENGLRVWAHQRPRSGTLALLVQLPVGSRHEDKRNNGVAHFVEHMVFTGTQKWPDENDVMEAIRRVGGYANAFVSLEQTVFYLHLKADDLELGLEWLAEVLFRPTLTEEKFHKESEVIRQEKGGDYGLLGRFFAWLEKHNLGYDVFWAVERRLFPNSSLLLPIIGTDESLRRIDHKTLVDFYRQYYVPNNMTLIAVGDLEREPFEAAVRAQFGSFPAGAAQASRAPLAVDRRPFDIRLYGPSINDRGQMLLGGVLGGGGDHPDRYAWWVLCEMLDTDLTEEIRHRRGLSYGVFPQAVLYVDAGYLYIYMSAESDRFHEIQDVIEAHLQRFIDGDIDPEKVENAKNAIRGRAMLNLEANMSMGWWLSADALTIHDADELPVPNFFAGIAAVTPADLQRVAREVLTPEKRFRVIHRPMVTPRRLRPWLAGAGMSLVGAAVALAARYYRDRARWRL